MVRAGEVRDDNRSNPDWIVLNSWGAASRIRRPPLAGAFSSNLRLVWVHCLFVLFPR
jgi:hypothetical protein